MQRKLVAKVIAKLEQADLLYESELGKTQGLWLISALMLNANDTAFIKETRRTTEVARIAKGLVPAHTFEAKAIIISYAKQFAAGR